MSNWVDNNIRVVVIQAQPILQQGEGLKAAIRAYRAGLQLHDLTIPAPSPLVGRYRQLLARFQAADALVVVSARTKALLNLFLEIQTEVEQLGQAHVIEMKVFGSIPEAHTRVTPITVYPQAACEIYLFQFGLRPIVQDPAIWDSWLKVAEVRKLRPSWDFSHVGTDGTTLWVYFKKNVPKPPFIAPAAFRTRPVDITRPGLYFEANTFAAAQLEVANLVCLDPGEARGLISLPPSSYSPCLSPFLLPGVLNLISAVRVDDVDKHHPSLYLKANSPILQVSQAQYREESLLNFNLKKTGILKCKVNKKRAHPGRNPQNAKHGARARRWRKRKRGRVRVSHALRVPLANATAALTAAPSPKRVNVGSFLAYMTAQASVWDDIWAYHGAIKQRKRRLFVRSRRDAWLDKLVNEFEVRFGHDPVILFGSGAEHGLFGRLKGGGVKGPVKKISRLLGKRYAVIITSEFRTTKLCIRCGRELHVHKHGVVYCKQQSHCNMLDRDISAAIKIGARFIAKYCNLPLGPWAYGAAIAPSTALAQVFV